MSKALRLVVAVVGSLALAGVGGAYMASNTVAPSSGGETVVTVPPVPTCSQVSADGESSSTVPVAGLAKTVGGDC